MKRLREYATIAFDCDGVVLNSNRIKTEAFRLAAAPYGDEHAQTLVDHHVKHGGVSRYKKFAWFVDEVLGDRAGPGAVDELLASFAAHVREGLRQAEVTPQLKALREQTASSRWLIVSGGAQHELREVFAAKGLDALFDGGIFGSPDDKFTIFEREGLAEGALYLGDSKLDWEVADRFGTDFLFVSAWSEVHNWRAFCEERGIEAIERVDALLERV